MTSAGVSIENLTVRYPVVVSGTQRSLFAGLANSMSAGRIGRGVGNLQYVTALRDLSLEISQGDRIGLVGRNGAGKSTLLKVIAGVLPPSRGTVRVVGETANILSIGSGMDMDLTGFENIERMSRLLNIPQSLWAEIKADVEDFTELGKFLAMPVRTYSAGMSVRLAFAMATVYPRDVLVVDEVIGAGDMFFVKKAVDRIQNYANKAKIMVFATHSMLSMEGFCNRAIHMESGKMLADGSISEVWDSYLSRGGV